MKAIGIFDLRLQPLQRLSEHIARHPACESKRILIIQVISSISLLVRLILHSLPDGYAFRVDLSDLFQSFFFVLGHSNIPNRSAMVIAGSFFSSLLIDLL